jgi:hypothetical protein
MRIVWAARARVFAELFYQDVLVVYVRVVSDAGREARCDVMGLLGWPASEPPAEPWAIHLLGGV